jgi:hypothetical protein
MKVTLSGWEGACCARYSKEIVGEETVVTAYNGAGTSLELLVNFTRENSGQVYVQPTGCFLNVIEWSFAFESRFAVFGFDEVEIQVK